MDQITEIGQLFCNFNYTLKVIAINLKEIKIKNCMYAKV